MATTTAFFYLFSLVMLYSAFRVITARLPVHAVLFLILAFSQAAGLWMLLHAEFLALILIMVYMGAVMVLFLFVVMMLDVQVDDLRAGFWRHFPLALIVGLIIAGELALVMFGGFDQIQATALPDAVREAAMDAGQFSNTKALGILMFTEYLFPVEVGVTILLLAMIAAIALAFRHQRRDNKAMEPGLQVRVRPEDRVRIVKMQSVRSAPAAAPSPDSGSHESRTDEETGAKK